MPLFGGFDKNATRMNLRMAITRMKQMKNKQEATIKTQKREVADLLRSGKEQLARVRVEHVIVESRNLEALELLELFCDMLIARFPLIESESHCPEDIVESVSTLIWAATRSNVPELIKVKDQFRLKYGKDFTEKALLGVNVHVRITHRMNYSAPEGHLVMKHLQEIAQENDIPWEGENVLEGTVVPDLPGPILPQNGNNPPPMAPGYGTVPATPYGVNPPPPGYPNQGYPYPPPPNGQQPQYGMPPPPGQQQPAGDTTYIYVGQQPPGQATQIVFQPPNGQPYPPPGQQFAQPAYQPAQYPPPPNAQGGAPPPPPQQQQVPPPSAQPPLPKGNRSNASDYPYYPPAGGENAGGGCDRVPGFDELTARFEALRRKGGQ